MIRATLILLCCLAIAQAVEINRVLPTGSMIPVFNEHYYLLVEKREFKTLAVGQVIVYRCKTPIVIDGIAYHSVVHAVWRKSSEGRVILCKGTNNPVPDRELITEADYLGTVVCWVDHDTYYSPTFDVAAEAKKPAMNVLDMMDEQARKIFLDGAAQGG